MARLKSKPTKLQQILEFPLVILGGMIEGCQFIARRLRRRQFKERLEIVEKPKSDPMAKYSARIYFLAEKGTDEIRKLAERMEDKAVIERLDAAWFSVFAEFMNVYLHITEREAFSRFGNSGYREVMNSLVMFSIDCSVEMRFGEVLPHEECQAFKEKWVQRLNMTNQLYGRCKKLIAGSNEPPEGTVLGQFGVMVSKLIGQPGNAMYISHCSEEAWGTGITLLAKDYVQEFVQNKAEFNLHVEKNSSANIRRWLCGVKELKREINYAKEHWNDKDLQNVAIAKQRELDQQFDREMRGGERKN